MMLLLTCEHGGNNIPDSYKFAFQNASEILETHRGYDHGALDVFMNLKELSNYSIYSKTSRLLIELNRSLHHKQLFSEFSKSLSKEQKKDLIATHYIPYRNAVEFEISRHLRNNEPILHLSIHSFTPHLNGVERQCDIGLLYDSKRYLEKRFSAALKAEIKNENPDLNIRYNYPYLGKSDGFTSYLRQKFTHNYLGIEIEINQKFSKLNVMDNNLKAALRLAIQMCLKKE